MTLPPVDHYAVTGVPGPEYKVGPYCCNPTCGKFADDPHHMFRRTRTGGPADWVQIDDYIVANKVAVCRHPCHEDLTGGVGGYAAAIRFDEDTQEFWWCLVTGNNLEPSGYEYHPIGLIQPQPPTPLELASASAAPEGASDRCPTCGQHTRRRGPQGLGPRRRKTWLVKVPDDEQERGADVLDSLVENLAPYVPNADSSAVGRYYVLVPVLVYATQDAKSFVKAMEGIGG